MDEDTRLRGKKLQVTGAGAPVREGNGAVAAGAGRAPVGRTPEVFEEPRSVVCGELARGQGSAGQSAVGVWNQPP